jgi:hypothetical protein
MRGAMLIGLAVVSLIIGILVIKNMGADKPGGAQKSQAKSHIEKAKTAADDLDKRFKDLKKKTQAID